MDRKGGAETEILVTILRLVKLALILFVVLAFTQIMLHLVFPPEDSVFESFDMVTGRMDAVLQQTGDAVYSETALIRVPKAGFSVSQDTLAQKLTGGQGFKYIYYFFYLKRPGVASSNKEDTEIRKRIEKDCSEKSFCFCMVKAGFSQTVGNPLSFATLPAIYDANKNTVNLANWFGTGAEDAPTLSAKCHKFNIQEVRVVSPTKSRKTEAAKETGKIGLDAVVGFIKGGFIGAIGKVYTDLTSEIEQSKGSIHMFRFRKTVVDGKETLIIVLDEGLA